MAIFYQAFDYLILAFGFGFVVFFHELGHFLAAKYCDVKVEQFAVGFGPAIFSWRKGLGFRAGSSNDEYQQKTGAGAKERSGAAPIGSTGSDLTGEMAAADAKAGVDYKAPEPQIGETEYRLNWIPLGGYVKMLGQDDLKPGVTADDPRAYNNKPIRSRMLIVSAGVIMNVILAAIFFMILFLTGYPAPPAMVGGLISDSPAMRATNAGGVRVGLQPGDKIIQYDGKNTIGDFTKILLNVALTQEGKTVPLLIEHPDGRRETLYVTPAHPAGDSKGLQQMGIMQPSELAAPAPNVMDDWDVSKIKLAKMPDSLVLQPGDVITQINGRDVQIGEFWKLDEALAASDGKPVELTVRSSKGEITHPTITAVLQRRFGDDELNFAGMIPRTSIDGLIEKSPAWGKIFPGDVILSIDDGTDHLAHPTQKQVKETLSAAGEKEDKVNIKVLGLDGKIREIQDLIPNIRVDAGRKGLGIVMGEDEQHLVIAQTQLNSSAAAAKIPAGATLTAIDGQAVDNWFQVQRILAQSKAGQTLSVNYLPAGAEAKLATTSMKLSTADVELAQMIAFAHELILRPMPGVLHTSNPITAMEWGIVETRDLIMQFYLTLQRMFTGDVSMHNAMGPVGMFQAGAQFAGEGMGWLLWFLAQISANLAVVNFLPIPIVDGGLFAFLILEKIQGKPLSAETQRIVQMVGLVLILGVVILVTYQDIARWAGYN